MALITYPGTPRHQLVTLQEMVAAFVNTSKLTQSRQAFDLQYSWWEADVKVAPMKLEFARQWRVFFGRLRGPVNTFRLPIGAAQHQGSYVVSANGIGSGYTLATDGWPVSSTPLLAGDYVTVGSQLLALDADVVTNASGQATLQFHAPIRSSIPDNTVIETKNPFLTAALPKGAPALSMQLVDFQNGFGFSALEAY